MSLSLDDPKKLVPLRDQAHQAAGFTPLRFSHAQVAFDPEYVRRTLVDVVQVIRAGAPSKAA